MRVLTIEDDDEKQSQLRESAESVDENAVFVTAPDMASAMRQLQATQYDLIILDLMLPMVGGGSPVDVGGELLPLIARIRRNRYTNMIALTAYKELFDRREECFAAAGVFLIHYERESENWKPTILSLLRRSAAQSRCDFLIVCALELESNALFDTRASLGENRIENGLDTRDIAIGHYKGRVVGLPRAGLVNAASITTASIERFRPKLVAMTGICGGVKDRTKLGQVLVCERCWEYQVGKYVGGEFKFEPYQTTISELTRQKLALMCRSTRVKTLLCDMDMPEGVEKCDPKMATIVSGSAVIADDRERDAICKQHRNIDGVEMELSAVFRAAELLDESIVVIGAKGVSDFGDAQKGDDVQQFAAVAAGRFVVEAIEKLLGVED